MLRGNPDYHFRGNQHHHFTLPHNVNKTLILLSKTAVLQGFLGKKRPFGISPTRSILIFGFAFGFISGFAQNHSINLRLY